MTAPKRDRHLRLVTDDAPTDADMCAAVIELFTPAERSQARVVGSALEALFEGRPFGGGEAS